MRHSKAARVSLKPSDFRKSWGLHPDFPLFPLGDPAKPARLRWAKKVRGKLEYFGKVEGDPKGQAALVEWLRVKDALIAGRTRPLKDDQRITLRDLCNKFLTTKRTDVDSGKLSPRTFVEYSRMTELLVDTFGRDVAVADLRPDDFEKLHAKLSRKHGLATLGREITMVRSVFKYGVESDLIDRAVKFGPRFKSPSKSDKRKHKARQKHTNGARVFTPDDIRAMLASAGPQLRAMILLGINAGMGNTDCARLPVSAIKSGWLDFPRPKTGIERRIPLWKETIEALEVVLAKRGKPRHPENAGLVFLTRLGQPWVRYGLSESKADSGRVKVTGLADDAIAKSIGKLLTTLGLKRPGLSFYTLRHTFETIAGGSRDQVAVDAVMGHVDASMAAEYREHIEDDRLRAVVNHVRGWLFWKEVRRG